MLVKADNGEMGTALTWRAALATGASVSLLSCLASPQPALGPPDGPPPQMGIAISGMGGARSALTLTYPAEPGAQKVAEDADALANAGNWSVSKPQPTREDGNVYYEAEIAPAVALEADRSLPLFPFLHAFRRFPDIVLVFVGVSSGPPGDFMGSNRFISAQWRRSEGVTSYTVHVDDASFSQAEDVALTEAPLTAKLVTDTARKAAHQRPTWAVWLLLVLGAVGSGVFVWGLVWWGLSVRSSLNREAKKDKPLAVAKGASPGSPDSKPDTRGVGGFG